MQTFRGKCEVQGKIHYHSGGYQFLEYVYFLASTEHMIVLYV